MSESEQFVVITEAAAQRGDAGSVKTLLENLPVAIARDLTNQLATTAGGFSGMRYEAETQRAFWIAADSQHLLCVTLPLVTEEQAAQIWSEIQQRRCAGETSGVVAAYGRVVGVDMRPIRSH